MTLLLHGRHAGHAAHEDHVVDLVGREAGVGEGLLDGPDDAVDEVARELVELGPREVQVEVLGAVLVGA